MEPDEPRGKKDFSCEHCGHTFYASPPDEKYTFAISKKCFVCDVLGLGQYIERNFECDNCHKMTHLNWHIRVAHTDMERRKAEAQSFKYFMREI